MPNSFLLQNRAVNWTLTGKQVRTPVTATAPAGMPAEQVSALLEQAASKQPRILPSPAPTVLLNDVGGNALNVKVVFWFEIRKATHLATIRSDLRRAIDKIFRQTSQAH